MKGKYLAFSICIAIALMSFPVMAISEATLYRDGLASFTLDPSTSTVQMDSIITLNVNLADVHQCVGWQIYLFYSKSIVNIVSFAQGSFLKSVGNTFLGGIITNNYNTTHGRVIIYCALLGGKTTVSGSGTLCSILMKGMNQGSSDLTFLNCKLCDLQVKPIANIAFNGLVTVT